MASGAGKVWTTGRKWLGNLVPLGVTMAVGAVAWLVTEGDGLLTGGIAVVSLWWATNFFGLFGNSKMRRTLAARYRDAEGKDPSEWFVGIARPGDSNMLDSHTDLGFVAWEDERLMVWGEDSRVTLRTNQILSVRPKLSAHSLIGLGRWIEVKTDSASVLLEPRVRPTLFGNLRASKRLLRDLKGWSDERTPAQGRGSAGVS